MCFLSNDAPFQATFLCEDTELKRNVSASKEQGGLLVRRIRDVNDCLLVKWWRRFGSKDNVLWKRLICSIYRVERGDGNRIRFWIDKWLGNVSLKDEFPRIFSLSTNKE